MTFDMTQDSPLLNLGRFVLLGDIESGPLGRTVPAPRWPVPKVSLIDREFEERPHGEIDPDTPPPRAMKKCLSWRFYDRDGRPVGRLVEAAKTSKLLDRFIALRGATDQAICAFANEFGVLGLCRCELPRPPREPFTHHRLRITRPPRFHKEHRCEPAEIEPLDSWKWLANRAYRLLRFVRSEKQEVDASKWRDLMSQLNWWLVRSGAYLYCYRPTPAAPGLSGWRIGLDCQTVFDFIAVQLMDAAFHAGRLVPCSNPDCGKLFQPKRKPAAGKRGFCEQCGRRVSVRLAKRRQRARQSQEPPAGDPKRPRRPSP